MPSCSEVPEAKEPLIQARTGVIGAVVERPAAAEKDHDDDEAGRWASAKSRMHVADPPVVAGSLELPGLPAVSVESPNDAFFRESLCAWRATNCSTTEEADDAVRGHGLSPYEEACTAEALAGGRTAEPGIREAC